MKTLVTPTRLALGAAALLALLVVPVAVAGTEDDPRASASGIQQKVKKLKKQVKKANRAIAQLQQQVGGLQGEQGGARPPTGPAGGDLTDNFPNPQIGANAVGTGELQADSVTEPKIAADAVGTSELQFDSVTELKIADDAVGIREIAPDAIGASNIRAGAVGSDELVELQQAPNSVSVPPNGGVGEVTATCPPGTQLISGGAAFQFPSGELSESIDSGLQGWRAEGQNNGNQPQDLMVRAVCLQPGNF